MENQSTQQRVVEDYFHTTSGIGAGTDADRAASMAGLRRRLGPWLDVAGKDILDLGSGLGEACGICLDASASSATGVNLSQDEIDFANQHFDAKFVRQDVAEFLEASAPAAYDRVFALNLLEHLDKDTLVRVIEGAYRVLRPGGKLIAMVPNAISPFGTMTRYWDITHYNAFTPSSFLQVSRLCGFGDAIEYRECGPIAHGMVSGIRVVLWQGIRLLIRAYLMVELASAKGGIYTADMMVRLSKSTAPSQ